MTTHRSITSVYTFPSRKSLDSVKRKVKAITTQGTNQPLGKLLDQLNMVLRGWTSYFRHAVAHRAFRYLAHFTWWRVIRWIRGKHRTTNWKALRRRYYTTNRWWPQDGGVALINPATVAVTRYRYRGNIASPWPKLKAST